MVRKKFRWTLNNVRPAHRIVHRWKILDKKRAEEIGITNIIPGRGGIICVDVGKIPLGFSIDDIINTAELSGILLRHTYRPRRFKGKYYKEIINVTSLPQNKIKENHGTL